MVRLLPDVFYANKYEPWLREKYGDAWDNPKDKVKDAKKEAQTQFKKDRMQHGSDVTGHSVDSPTYKRGGKYKIQPQSYKDYQRSRTYL